MDKCMYKKIMDALIDQPFLGSIFIVDFALLLWIKTPIYFSILMLGGLMAMSMYYGQKLALFKMPPAEQTKQAD